MVSYKLHLIRHGLTDGNRQGLYIGRTDLPVCEEGLEQLCELSAQCEYPPAQKVYASPLTRCVQTAELLYPDVWTETLADLQECDFGDFEGRSIAELKSTPEFLHWVEGGGKAAPPNGESGEQLAERITAAVEYIIRDMMRLKITNAAVVGHGGLLMLLLALHGIPKRPMRDWTLANGKGYTAVVTPQLWMRDHVLEVAGRIPGDGSDVDPYDLFNVLDLDDAEETEEMPE